ncbi:hypothetical protein QJS10_CPB17g01955 [Acorus calamus]|uniref:Uncharacterized protein n=1 Tax=Acorus calamus TaxID=4465 RepID=A0AAV9CS83_ACOCL|nr:hypothetical protein QJS10_CPB17g01955 [Acorus calamus]
MDLVQNHPSCIRELLISRDWTVSSRLTLDEMVETVVHQMEAVSQGGFLDAAINSQQVEDVENGECSGLVETIDATHLEQIQPARQEMKETEAEDKLRSLLKQCNVVQNMIDERLAVLSKYHTTKVPKVEPNKVRNIVTLIKVMK